MGTWVENGGAPFEPGNYEVLDTVDPLEIEVRAHPGITPTSKVIAYLPGTIGFSKPESMGPPPQPCIEVFIKCGGKSSTQGRNADSFRRSLPESVINTLRIVRKWADSAHITQQDPNANSLPPRRSVAIFCFSRGAAWGLQICNMHGSLIDYAWIFAGFPSTKDQWTAKTEAITTMQAEIPIVMVQFVTDFWCNKNNYPTWYAALESGMSALPSNEPGHRRSHFWFFNLPGDHDTAQHFWHKRIIKDLSVPPELGVISQTFWTKWE